MLNVPFVFHIQRDTEEFDIMLYVEGRFMESIYFIKVRYKVEDN